MSGKEVAFGIPEAKGLSLEDKVDLLLEIVFEIRKRGEESDEKLDEVIEKVQNLSATDYEEDLGRRWEN